jgi:cephalosporin hydroxylase
MPSDLLIYQELIVSCEPTWIIETGTFKGGSALFMADVCSLIGWGRVITIDTNLEQVEPLVKKHKLVHTVQGSSTDPDTVEFIKAIVKADDCLVVLDSSHFATHVIKELEAYQQFVRLDGYLIVEDGYLGTAINETVVGKGEGPAAAIHNFLSSNSDFRIDKELCSKHLVSFNPDGYLRRVSE